MTGLTSGPKDEVELKKFLDGLENGLENIEKEYGETLWKKYLRETCDDLEAIERRRSEIILNNQHFSMVREWKTKARNPILSKRLLALERIFLRERVEAMPDVSFARNRIIEQHIAFRPIVLGKQMDRTDVDEILRKEPDASKRKAAWESFSEYSQRVEKEVVKLIKLRNKHAQELGYKTFVDYSLSQNLIDSSELLKLFEELDEPTESTIRAVLDEVKQKLCISQLEPWDVFYVMDQFVSPPDKYFPKELMLSKIESLVRSLGVNPERLPILVKQADIPFAGICFPIKIPTDMRILVNPRDGHRFYKTLFHEYGHALHGCFINQPSYALKIEVGCFAEGTARIIEQFTSDYFWLRENTPLSDDETRRFVKAQKALRLLRIRNFIGTSIFEYKAYEDPDQDLNKLFSEVWAKYMFVCENETPRWATEAAFVTNPIYLQNYVLAEMIAAQTIEHLEKKSGKLLDNRQVSRFLIENYYSPGGSVDWSEKIERATGSRLTAKALVRKLVS
jgi:oligoendopeptidase F